MRTSLLLLSLLALPCLGQDAPAPPPASLQDAIKARTEVVELQMDVERLSRDLRHALRKARALLAPLQSVTVAEWNDALLGQQEQGLIALSDAITARYFLHHEKPDSAGSGHILG